MTKHWIKIAAIPALALAIFLPGCDSLGDSTRPELDPRGYAIFSTSSGEQYVVTREPVSYGIVSGTIGNAGGELHLGVHSLVVPAGAVSEATVFTMSRPEGDLLRLSLSATRESYNDVGAAGFAVPLQLRLSFVDAGDLPADVSKLEVIYFEPTGTVAPQPTYLDVTGGVASGDIPHFSDFGLAWPF